MPAREGHRLGVFSTTVISFYASDAASFLQAWVAKLADATDLKSVDPKGSCGFDSRPRHHTFHPQML